MSESGADPKHPVDADSARMREDNAEVETLFAKLTEAHDCNLLKGQLTRSVLDELKDKTTKLGGTLADCIRSGCEHPDSHTGVHACDPEAYAVFAPLLDGVIRRRHGLPAGEAIQHPAVDYGDVDGATLDDLDPDRQYVLSTRVRVARSVEGFGFHPVLNREDRLRLEHKVAEALRSLPGEELGGEYHPLTDMDPSLQEELIRDHYLYTSNDKFRRTAGAYDDWPAGRGIFFNTDKTFLVWVNEEDQIRIIAMQAGGDLRAVYARMVRGARALQDRLCFVRDARLGYLTFCPSNLGTGMRASVLVRLPKLSQRPDFQAVLAKLRLESRGFYGGFTESVDGVYDISNKRRLGLTEMQAVTEMYEGVKEILRMEKAFTEAA